MHEFINLTIKFFSINILRYHRALFSEAEIRDATERFITRTIHEERSVSEDFGVGPIDRRRSRSRDGPELSAHPLLV